SGKAASDADLVAADVAGNDDAQVGGPIFHHEDLEGVGSLVADDGVARDEDGVLASGQHHLGGGKHARAQIAVRGLETRLQNENAGTGIDRRVQCGDLTREVAAGVRGHARLDLHAQLHLRCPLFGSLQLQLEGADFDDGGDLVGEGHVDSSGNGAGGNVAI